MANPNPNVYGAPETWGYINSGFAFTGNGNAELKTEKPKMANFGNGSTLGNGSDAGKTPIGEPIDPTICPCGQDIAVSPFAKMAFFSNHGNTISNGIPDYVSENTQPCNWFIGGATTNQYQIGDKHHMREYGDSSNRWIPNTGIIAGNLNGNIKPIVYWQLKSFLISIQVICITGYAADGTPSITNRTLAAWKESYSTQPICDVRMIFRGVDSSNSSNIVYKTLTELGDYDTFVLSPMVEMINAKTGDKVTDYIPFVFGKSQTAVDIIGHNFYDNVFNNTKTFVMSCYDYFENQIYKGLYRSGVTDGGWQCWTEIPYSDENYERVLKMVASFGCIFTPTNKTTFATAFTDSDLYIPIIDDEGITHGEYTRGSGNTDNDLYDADSIRDKNYDPSVHHDPNIYSDTTSWNSFNLTAAFTKRYLLSASQVGQLSTELWAAQSSKPADIDFQNFAVDEYLTNNPIDTIVSLKYFPCSFPDVAPAVVHLGKYQTNIAATALGTSVRVIDFAPIEIYRHFGDFRDFEPYTQLSMYIPFCGTVSIPTAEAMGNYVSVKLCIDVGTGAATGYVIVSKSGTGGICVATATGTAAIDIPVSGLQSANLSQAVFNAAAQWTQTQISNLKVTSGLMQVTSTALSSMQKGYASAINTSSVTKALKGGPIGAATFAIDSLNPVSAFASGATAELDKAKAEYDLTHIEMPMRLIGSISPALSSVIESNCRLIIYRPITDESALSHYADTVGYATIKSGTVGQFSGYTEATIDVSGINATAEEKAAISAAFASGVYL